MEFQVIAKKVPRYFNGTAIATFSKIPFSFVLSISLVLYLKDLKLSLSSIIALILASSYL